MYCINPLGSYIQVDGMPAHKHYISVLEQHYNIKTCACVHIRNVAYLLYVGTVEPTGTRNGRVNGLYRRVARRQLCERLDCATVSWGHVTSAFPQVTSPPPARCRATLGKHPFHARLRRNATVLLTGDVFGAVRFEEFEAT
jgi:hypothetical protein